MDFVKHVEGNFTVDVNDFQSVFSIFIVRFE